MTAGFPALIRQSYRCSFLCQWASKSQNELMPFLMAVAARSRQNGMTFTPEETNLIIEVMKQGKSKEEIARIEKIRMMMRQIK